MKKLIFILAAWMIFCLGACSPKQKKYSQFADIPERGWLKGEPLGFEIDSTLDVEHAFDMTLAIRHDTGYRYTSIGMTVDVVAGDTVLERKRVVMELADGNGNWLGAGFGAMYQKESMVGQSVKVEPGMRIIVWQTSGCDTLQHVSNVGVTLNPAD